MKEVLDLLELASLQGGQTDDSTVSCSDESDQINNACGEPDQVDNSPIGT
jgi:hypothetical protein